MKLQQSSVLIIFLLVLNLALLTFNSSGAAQNVEESKFNSLFPIDGGQGTIRFFDRRDGTLYTYDRTLQKVLRIVRLVEMGEPAEIIMSDSRDGESRYVNPRERK